MSWQHAGMVPVERAELVTRDVDLLAELASQLYVDHGASISCPDPARARGVIRSATTCGLAVTQVSYTGMSYTAALEPVNQPIAATCTRGSGSIASAREEVRVASGHPFVVPARLPSVVTVGDGTNITLQIPWEEVRFLVAEHTGIPAGGLRFESMAPVSAAAQRGFALTTEFICGQLITSGVTEVHPLLLPELIRVAAAAFLTTFPSTATTAAYVAGPGWVPTAPARRAAAFIEAHADQPVTMAEIAAAAGVTARALQYAFRRHYGTTPTGYLRRVRLERAHQELQATDPGSGLTVKAVALRWGWASHSRFTVAYHERFGVLPSHTLRI